MNKEKPVTIEDVMTFAYGCVMPGSLRAAIVAYGQAQRELAVDARLAAIQDRTITRAEKLGLDDSVQGEPVAWVSPAYFVGKLYGFTISPIKVADGQIPLYAAPQQKQEPLTDEQTARLFHDTYERLAPSFGYETRADTKAFDPESANGRLMIAVCREVAHNIRSAG